MAQPSSSQCSSSSSISEGSSASAVTGGKSKRQRWTATTESDILHEIINHAQDKPFSRASSAWDKIAKRLSAGQGASSTFTARACHDHAVSLITAFKKEDNKSKGKSGVEEEVSERKQLLQEVYDLYAEEEERKAKSAQARKKDEEDCRRAELMRQDALVSLKRKRVGTRLSSSAQADANEAAVYLDSTSEEEHTSTTPPPKKQAARVNVAAHLAERRKQKAQELALRERELKMQEEKFALEREERMAVINWIKNSTKDS